MSRPRTLSDQIAEIERKVRVQEGASRLPTLGVDDVNGIRIASTSASCTPEARPSGTLADPASGSDGPDLTIRFGKSGRALINVAATGRLEIAGPLSAFEQVVQINAGWKMTGANERETYTNATPYAMRYRTDWAWSSEPPTKPSFYVNVPGSQWYYVTGLTPGLTTVSMVYAKSNDSLSGTGTFVDRTLIVIPL